MSLFKTSNIPNAQFTAQSEVASKIQQRRYQILVHSLLYYELDMNMVSDHQWSAWAEELVQLQKQNPEVSDKVIFADAFRSFDGSTGFDLPYADEQIVNIAYRLLQSESGNEEYLSALRRIRTTRAVYEGFYNKSDAPRRSTQPQRKAVKKVEPTKRKKLF